jgi:hypothetical protein
MIIRDMRGGNSNFPHYHFQMRIDNKQFINFGQHHIPFSEKDLFNLDLLQQKPEIIRHSFGSGGSGMQEAVELDPDDILKHTTLTENEEDAMYHMQTTVMAKDEPLKGDDLKAMFEESRNTGKPIASLVNKYLGENAEIQTVISPVDAIPDIAKRTGRRKKLKYNKSNSADAKKPRG